MLIAAGREGRRLPVDEVCDQLKMSPQELREDISVLNVVNFGGGAYVIYAEVLPSGEIEVDPEPYSDTFDRPARLLPIEAKALVAAIDLLNLAQPELGSAREKVVEALGHDPVEEGLQITSPTVADDVAHTVERAVHDSRLLSFEYWSAEQQFSQRTGGALRALQRHRGLVRRRLRSRQDRLQHFRLDRIKSADRARRALRAPPGPRPDRRRRRLAAHRHGRGLAASRASGSRPSRRAGRARSAPSSPSSTDGAIVVELPFKGIDYLVKEILKEAGDAAVLEPADGARGGAGRRRAPARAQHVREPPRADRDGGRARSRPSSTSSAW